MSPRTKQRLAITALLLLLTAGFEVWRTHRGSTPVTPPPAPVPVPGAPTPPSVKPITKPVVPPLLPKPPIVPPVKPPVVVPTPPKPVPPPEKPVEGTSTSPIPKPPPITLHPELIPKNIEIVRVYYDRGDIMGPETTFGFDINGSGFTDEFQNMIQVDPGGLDIQVKNLRRVTANQIHGEMVVGSAQTTEFIYPKVLIHNLPVFRSPDPFAVVRPGEVLVIVFVSLAEDGRSGRFRAVTNLDETMSKQFKVVPSHPGLEISPLEYHLPFAVEGVMQIGTGVPQGEYGLAAVIGQRQVWKRDGMIRIVRPNVGATGFVQGVSAEDKYYRPGDTIQMYLHGSGLTAAYTASLNAHINEFDMGAPTFQFISAAQMRFSFRIPNNAPLRAYGVTVTDSKKTELFKRDEVFTLVPANWIRGVQVSPPIKPGRQGILRVQGRDISREYARDLQLTVDEPGIELKNPRPLDASTLGYDISIDSGVAPGDYWIHLTYQGKALQPPYGSLIKVEAP